MIVNNCYAAVTTLLGKESSQAVDKFWEQPPQIWDTVNNVGLRANYIASVFAARLMVPRYEIQEELILQIISEEQDSSSI